MQAADELVKWLMTAGFFGVIAMTFALYRKMASLEERLNIRVNGHKENTDKQIGRTYQRLDEVKTHTETNFVKKEMCGLMHKALIDAQTLTNQALTNAINELKEKVNCIPKIKLGINMLLTKAGMNAIED